jgi:D-3-phosphoglycerate dehydrogenase
MIKILGIGDPFIPADIIKKGLSGLDAEVSVLDWELPDEAELQRLNHIVESEGCEAVPPPDYVFDAAKDCDIIVTQFCPITQRLIDACPKLKCVGVLRAGCENVNVAHATQKDVLVVNTPGRNANSVADFTIGMMLAEARNIARAHLLMKDGQWVRQYPNSFYIPDMYGKTVGLIGFGEIGRGVARRLSGFDVRILVYDPYVKEMPEGITACTLPELMRESDFVSVHVRSTKETENLVSAEMIALMKPTSYFINSARPAVVDEDALYKALRDKRIAGAAIDVFNVEPPGREYPLVRLDNVTLTPHMAGGSRDAFYGSPGKLAVDLKVLLASEAPPHIMNREVVARNGLLNGNT